MYSLDFKKKNKEYKEKISRTAKMTLNVVPDIFDFSSLLKR